ncbi:MAG TPA: hypothetical protein VIO61_15825 [Anaerolineaceae bacterium]
MNHQLYETWILDGEAPAGKEAELQAHLLTCTECQRLQRGWQGAHHMVRTTPPAQPRPGFSRRFQANLAERRARLQYRQIFLVFLGGSAAALTVFAITMVLTGISTTPTNLIVGFTRAVVQASQWVNLAQTFANTWLKVVPLPINIAIWVALTGTFCLLCLAWAAAIWRIFTKGVQND